MSVLLDASFILALLNEDDVHHQKAKVIVEKIDAQTYGGAFTTDHILDETISVALRKFGKEKAVHVGKYILNKVHLIIADDHVVKEAWNFFEKTLFNFSFTDCLTIIIMKMTDTEFLATFDKEFTQAKEVQVIA